MKAILFAENMKYLRTNEGVSQTEMAATIGFKRSTWNGYERGSSLPGIGDLIKIADYFGITESDLLRTDLAESDIHLLYNSYIHRHPDPKNIGSAPRSTAFSTYFNTVKATTGTEETSNAAKTNPKKRTQPHVYPSHDAGKNASFLNEDGSEYTAKSSTTVDERLARLEGDLKALKDIIKGKK